MGVASDEKSPWRNAADGTVAAADCVRSMSSRSNAPKKNVLPRTIGPPALSPTFVLSLWFGVAIVK